MVGSYPATNFKSQLLGETLGPEDVQWNRAFRLRQPEALEDVGLGHRDSLPHARDVAQASTGS